MTWHRRFDAALLCFLANLIAHCDRVAISAAVPAIMRENGWDTARMGWVLSGFFLGYALCMIPAGLAVHRFGPRRVLAACMGWWSLCTVLTALPRSIGGLTAMRILLGAGESGTAPCINATLVRWFPPAEYSRATGLAWSAGYAGPILAIPVATMILHQWGWRTIFVCFGVLGFAWLPLWMRLPEPKRDAAAPTAVPWRSLLAQRSVWAVFALHFSSNWILYVMVSWLPTYLSVERHFSLPTMVLGASLPFAFAWCGANAWAWVVDRAAASMDRTRASKCMLVPFTAAALCVLLVPSASTPEQTVALLCAAMGLFTAATPVFSSASLDLAPEFAGVLASLQNTFANLAGIIAPAAAGTLAAWYGWHSVFWLTSGVAGMGAVGYGLFGRATRIEVRWR